jgi:CheY-like chemotaxis protein
VTEGHQPAIRVLVVDDAADIRELLAIALRLEGADVVSVPTGPDALARLASDPPFDVMVLDLQMPDCDGWDVLAAVADMAPPIPRVVVCSVKSSDADYERAMAAGAAAYVLKPFDVAPTVEYVLSLRQLR